jgi:hypothetical protein
VRSLSPTVLREIRDFLLSNPTTPAPYQLTKWLDAIDRALGPKRSVGLARRRKAQKDIERQEKITDIREQVWLRSNGRCEACGIPLPSVLGELDHALGGSGRRRALESVETTWRLDHRCHVLKTNNDPTAFYWAEKFAEHCRQHGYTEEAEMAMARVA